MFKKISLSHLFLGIFLVILIFGIFFVTLLSKSPSKTAKTVNSINKKTVNSEKINYNDFNQNTVGDSYVKNQDSQKMPVPQAAPAPVIEKDEIISTLRDASVTYDKASFPKISPYLSSAEPDIRQEAINAIVNIGDPAGAPILRAQAAKEADINKKKELLDLADWLELPSATLILPQKKSAKTNKSTNSPSGKAP
jgi:hypothetical protein